MASWFRWYHGCVSDPKLGVVARKASQPKFLVIAVWAALLEMASQAAERGDVTGFDADDFAEALGADTEAVQAVFNALGEKGLIETDRVAAWAKRQFEGADTTAASRQKRKRERDKPHVTESHAVTDRDGRDNRNVTASEQIQTQIRTDSETEKVKTARKENGKAEDGAGDLPEFLRADLRPRMQYVAGGAQRFAGVGPDTAKRIKPPDKADAAMIAHLTGHCGMDNGKAWEMVIAARDPENPDHIHAARQCEKHSRKHKLGWFHAEAAQ
jgi:hypothetical protein